MKHLYKPYGFLFTMTLPQIIIGLLFSKLFYSNYYQLTHEGRIILVILSSYFCVSLIVFTGYMIKKGKEKKEVDIGWIIGIFISYIIFIVVYFFNYEKIIPSNILVLDKEPGIHILTGIVPVLIHTMISIAFLTMEKYKIKDASKDICCLLGIPIIWYLGGFLLGGEISKKIESVIPILFIVSLVAFIFLFIRIGILILGKNNLPHKEESFNVQKKWVLIALLGSLLGLLVNESCGNILGDFSHSGFYILAIVTPILIISPIKEDIKMRLFLFIGKSITFIFTLYFFMVFLPYIPLAFLGIIFMGLGILMLIPILLMYLHTRSLWNDFKFLNIYYSKSVLILIFIIGLSILPSFFIINISNDKECLNYALKYVYERSYDYKHTSMENNINISAIKRTLKNIKYMKGMSRDDFSAFTTKTPYITEFYDAYVLDHLSISTRKIHRLEEIFLGESDVHLIEENVDSENKDVKIKNITIDTKLDNQEGTYKSWIHFHIENTTDFQNEYTTEFKLPEGSYISDYYLYVGENKKHGMIADKRAANWVYQKIRNIRKDPGILTYKGNNKIDFKVFPFNEREIRKTGIEITHRTPISLDIDGNMISLNTKQQTQIMKTNDIEIHPGISYITNEMKDNLPKEIRKPKYYFVLDYSNGNEDHIEDYMKRTKNYIQKNNIKDHIGKIIALNYEENMIDYKKDWEQNLKDIEIKGGFYLDYTFKRILYEHYMNHSNEYPVIIAVTNHIDEVILSKELKDFEWMAPEGLNYYHLNDEEKLEKYDLISEKSKKINQLENTFVRVWESKEGEKFYLPDHKEDSIILNLENLKIKKDDYKDFKWENGVILKGMYMNQQLHPEKLIQDSLDIVKASISNKVMSPLTSFIVLETKDQERDMLQKQKQILATNKALDVGDLNEMDEPSIKILIILGIVFLLGLKTYKKRFSKR